MLSSARPLLKIIYDKETTKRLYAHVLNRTFKRNHNYVLLDKLAQVREDDMH